MSVLNSTIVEKAWLEGSNSFAQRVPNPSINGMAAAVEAIFDPYNNDLYNEFSGLLNGVANTYVEGKRFENPLRELKKPAAMFGNSERHVAVKYMQAHSYKADDETLLKLEKPEFVEYFYSVTRKDRYEFSWSRQELARAFSADGYGFNELLSATVDQMISSDNYDEMNIMLQMFAEADKRMGGLYREHISAAPTDKATGQELLAKIRATVGRMSFPNIYYNHIDVPVFETMDNPSVVVWVTPETDANLDVYALADLFHTELANLRYRKIVIPEFPIPNVYAAVTSEDFIYCRDVEYGVYSFFNPANLTDKRYLHHWSMIGANPAAQCALFTTDAQTTIPTITVAPNGMSFTPNAVEVAAGGEVQLQLNLTGTVDGDNGGAIAVEPDAAIFSVSAVRGADDAVQAVTLNSRTYVDERAILHVQKSGLEIDDVITITAKSAYINPSGETNVFTATATATVVDATPYSAKECPVEEKPYIEYTNETEAVTASE